MLYWHLLAGYLFSALVVFRLFWGLISRSEAGFRAFAYSPREALAYIAAVRNGGPKRYLGHNPAGSWAIYAMLLLGLSIALTGLLTLGAEERQGPLAGLLDFAWGQRFHQSHELLAWTMLSLVVFHLLGVIFESRIHNENLILSMITGRKRLAASTAVDASPHRGVAVGMLLGMLAFGGVWARAYLAAGEADPFIPFPGPELASNPLWDEECGACHMAYHPSLLPARAWAGLFARQDEHFDEDLALDASTIDRLLQYAQANAAETSPTEAAWKLLAGIAPGEMPRRITNLPYWREKHADVPEALWQAPDVSGRYNCDACHLDAAKGWFADGAMHLPANIPNVRIRG